MNLNILLVTKNTLAWLFSILKKFYLNVPKETSLILFFSVVSQLSITIYFLLPLKILLILSSNRLPHYLPDLLLDLGLNRVVLLLTVLVLVFFIVHYYLEKMIELLVKKGVNVLLAKSNKLVIFNNQNDMAFNAYNKLTKAISSILFSSLILLVLLFLYTKLFLLIVVYFLSVFLFTMYLSNSNNKFNQLLEKKFNDILNFISSIGFFIVFLFIINDILHEKSLNILLVLISILFTRQMFSQLFNAIKIIKVQFTNRKKINALFYHTHQYGSNNVVNQLWLNFLEEKEAKQFLMKILNISDDFDYKWLDLSIKDVLVFQVKILDLKKTNFVVFLYEKNKKLVSEYQSDLYNHQPDIINHRFVKMGYEQDFTYQVFDISNFKKISVDKYKNLKIDFIYNMMRTTPNVKFLEKYKKSKLLIYDRIKKMHFFYLKVAIEEEKENYEYFIQILPKLLKLVQELPLQYYNPYLIKNNVLINEKGKETLLYWGSYAIEPLGVNFPLENIESLYNNIDRLKKERDDMKNINININDIVISSLLSHLEKAFNKQQMRASLEIIKRITDFYKKNY